MIDDDQHTVSDCHDGFLLTQARSEMMELSRKVIVPHSCEHPGDLRQNRTQVAVAFGRLAIATFACTQTGFQGRVPPTKPGVPHSETLPYRSRVPKSERWPSVERC